MQNTFKSYECLLSKLFIDMIEIKGVSKVSRRFSVDYVVCIYKTKNIYDPKNKNNSNMMYTHTY